jgi:hypothetical protein
VSTCKNVVDPLVTTPVVTAVSSFTTTCLPLAPEADSADCYEAYATLIEEIEKLDTTGARLQLRTSVSDAFDDFVSECATTARAQACSNTIKDVVVGTGPDTDDLANIKRDCKIEPPPTVNQPDGGIINFSKSSGLLLLMSSVIYFYFVL